MFENGSQSPEVVQLMTSESIPSILLAAIKQSDFSVVITTGELDTPGPVFVHVNTGESAI